MATENADYDDSVIQTLRDHGYNPSESKIVLDKLHFAGFRNKYGLNLATEETLQSLFRTIDGNTDIINHGIITAIMNIRSKIRFVENDQHKLEYIGPLESSNKTLSRRRPRRPCVVCLKNVTSKKLVFSRFCCSFCQVPLCDINIRSCFTVYHSNPERFKIRNYQKKKRSFEESNDTDDMKHPPGIKKLSEVKIQ